MNVGLVQINNSFGGASYFPYSLGCLQAYAHKKLDNPGQFEFLLPLYKREDPDMAVRKLLAADIVFFSLYVWNRNMSFEIARRLKEKKPEVIIVVGGPEVPNHIASTPDRVKKFLKKNPFIDIACHREGEQVFVSVLDNCWGDWKKIVSASYLRDDGACVENPVALRLSKDEVLKLSSPYLEGVFDPLMKAYPDQEWLVMWETNRGCPFACTFCDWGDLVANKVFQFDMDRLKQEIEWVAAHKIEFMFCADANFGIFPRDVEIARFAAKTKEKYGYPKALSVQNAKNAEERIFQAQLALHQAGLNKGVTLAFQSRDEHTLTKIKRNNISSKDFRNLQSRFTRAGMTTYSDMILALPGETYDSFADGVSQTIEEGQHNRIQYGNLSLLPNAALGDPAEWKRYNLRMVTVKAKTYHGDIFAPSWEVDEEEELVVATNTLFEEDWVRARAFSWMSALLHFDKIFQIPLIVLHECYAVNYRTLIEIFSECDDREFSVIMEIKNFFREKARAIQQGDVEYCAAPEWLNIWWPADEYIFIKLISGGKIARFYEEAERAIVKFFADRQMTFDSELLHECVYLNRSLIKEPFQDEDLSITLSYNIWDFYQSVLKENRVPFEKKTVIHRIDRTSERWMSWDEWCKLVVWFGNKKAAYLYGNKPEDEKEGHF